MPRSTRGNKFEFQVVVQFDLEINGVIPGVSRRFAVSRASGGISRSSGVTREPDCATTEFH
jgi:hypothetical protein